MKRIAIVAVLVMGALAAVIGTAGAVVHYPTTLDSTGTSAGPPSSDVFIEYGRVHSPKRKCRSNRRLRMIAHYPSGSDRVLDRGRSSRNGAYALVGDFTGAEGGTIKAARKRIGRPGHRRICAAGSVPAD
jgi:hypothetical protein